MRYRMPFGRHSGTLALRADRAARRAWRPAKSVHLLGLLIVLGSAATAGCHRRAPASINLPRVDAPRVFAEADRMGGRDLWPGFDARGIPVALFDGDRTWLYGHPSPPAAYQPDLGHIGLWSRPGRDSLVWANSSAMLGGVRTATVMPGVAGASISDRASTIVHERFHVFQIARHPHWVANEVDLFGYPVSDGTLLARRRLESLALRRALAAVTLEATTCWSRTALDERRLRFARLPSSAVAYERGNEWREGLANYVQARAAGFPARRCPPRNTERRRFASGPMRRGSRSASCSIGSPPRGVTTWSDGTR